jgi:hypothetical protein
VFLLNSQSSRLSATCRSFVRIHSPQQAILLPKLRMHFAEFLNEGYPDRLAFLMPPTCVGLRYGHSDINATKLFSAVWNHQLVTLRSAIHSSQTADLPTVLIPSWFRPSNSTGLAWLSYCVTPSLHLNGAGILTCCPSPTTLVLGLGPTNPTRITLASEPSGFRR